MWERLVATIIGKCQTELIAVKNRSHNMLNFLAGKQSSFFGQIGPLSIGARAGIGPVGSFFLLQDAFVYAFQLFFVLVRHFGRNIAGQDKDDCHHCG